MKFKGFELTEEQLKVLSSAKQLKPGIPLIIDAGAGATKTFTSNAVASKVFMEKNILVLAYNSIIVEEMKEEFPDNCTVLTAHSFAKKHIKPFKEERLNTPVTIKLVDSELKLPEQIEGVSKQSFASIILKAINKYCVSDSSSIDEFVAANLSRFLKPNQLAAKDSLITYTKKLWTSMTDRASRFPTTHDVYLKEFVLDLEMGKIQLDYDVVILDEGQDTTPVVRRMLELLHAIVLIVGDKYQAIYEWRDAVNVMEGYIGNGNPVNRLTTCYRFGPEVAELANMLINEYYGVNPEFSGNPNKSTEIIVREPTSRPAQSLMLFRTNSELMSSLINKYEQGYSCCILKKPQEYVSLIDDAQRLYSGQKLLKGPLRLFNDWAEFSEHARSESGGEFKAFYDNIENTALPKFEVS
ncbi:UvrD-helicase domain-containing protein [Vibrio coralliilyticus]|uniref:UvrD-helicase domain-containing protein n=1 Tax=Vibrio coralliilyticus TaxID=190893 RepID=UPI001E51DAAB|nr:UvrD-helicase domain-containing protein [Vibrio coralliilyticus]MCC2525023.1 UvrD-helicase domain-containing protein [Vibrio coralliilyticus]